LVIEPISKIVSSFTIVALGALDVLPYPYNCVPFESTSPITIAAFVPLSIRILIKFFRSFVISKSIVGSADGISCLF